MIKNLAISAEVHKHFISISIQNLTSGASPKRYTNILFLFLSKIPPAAMAHRGTQTFYSDTHSSTLFSSACFTQYGCSITNACRGTQTFYSEPHSSKPHSSIVPYTLGRALLQYSCPITNACRGTQTFYSEFNQHKSFFLKNHFLKMMPNFFKNYVDLTSDIGPARYRALEQTYSNFTNNTYFLKGVFNSI